MPHVGLAGNISIEDLHRGFQPDSHREGRTILKMEDAFLSTDRERLLLECLVVEGHLRQSFFAVVHRRDDGAMIRLLPLTSPEKTDGVKQALVWISRWVRARNPDAAVGATNLRDFL